MEEVEPATFGRWVQSERRRRGLGVPEAARRGHISDNIWRQVERGTRATFRDATLVGIALGLELPIEQVMRRAGRIDDGGEPVEEGGVEEETIAKLRLLRPRDPEGYAQAVALIDYLHRRSG